VRDTYDLYIDGAWVKAGTLADLATMLVATDQADAPGTIVIGEVVSVGAALAGALVSHPSALAARQAV